MLYRLFYIFCLLSSLEAFAENWERTGNITFETRQFENDGVNDTFENQRALEVHYKGKGDFGENFFTLSFAGRYDDQDKNRNMLWAEDIYLQRQVSEKVSFIAGYKIFNYSYMEAFHPLDVVNARITDVSLVNADKMGELVIGVDIDAWDGNLRFYLLPHPTQPILPGRDSRLNLKLDFHQSVWIGQDGEENDWSDHFLISFERSFESFDLMFVTSKGMDRNRLLIGNENYTEFNGSVFPDSPDLFTPFYYERFFSGLNSVFNFDGFQLKSSLAYSYYLAEDQIYTLKELQNPSDYTVAALGFEKQVGHNNGMDSTLIAEGQKIFVSKKDEPNLPLQNDLFLAWRLSFNDLNSKQITLSTMLDLSKSEHEGFSQFIYSQRFAETWKIELFFIDYYIPGDANINGIGIFRDKEHVSMKFSRFF